MAWRLAKSLEVLRSQVNSTFPNRSKISDGSVGDTSHSARKSDHNPDLRGVVHAIDLTHDPKNGFDSYNFAEALRRMRDKRIGYIISNGRIAAPNIQNFAWRRYTGANKHDHHVHVSVLHEASLADSVSPWDFDWMHGKPVTISAADVHEFPPTLRFGDTGDDVKALQRKLGTVAVDGNFGPRTQTAVKNFQRTHGMVDDGIVGPYTWKALA